MSAITNVQTDTRSVSARNLHVVQLIRAQQQTETVWPVEARDQRGPNIRLGIVPRRPRLASADVADARPRVGEELQAREFRHDSIPFRPGDVASGDAIGALIVGVDAGQQDDDLGFFVQSDAVGHVQRDAVPD